jgi:DNA-binding XRE family transcriptional regulator
VYANKYECQYVLLLDAQYPTCNTDAVILTEEITVKLDAYRKLSGKSQAECAAELGVSVPTYWKWETGKMAPCAFNIREIIDWSAGAVTAADLIGVKS